MTPLEQAAKAHADGNHNAALTKVAGILQTDPRNADALQLAGQIAIRLNQVDQGVEFLARAAQLKNTFDSYIELVKSCVAANSIAQAVDGMMAAVKACKTAEHIHPIQCEIEAQYAKSLSTSLGSGGEPMFSIIMPHFDGAVSDEYLIRALDHIEKQSYRSFELLLIHDGHITRRLPPLAHYSYPIRVHISERRHNDWGHSLRDWGIHAARGQYILHHNADNILYPSALDELNRLSMPENYPSGSTRDGAHWSVASELMIFPIYQMGWACDGQHNVRIRQFHDQFRILLTGFPARVLHIDAMQLVMTRKKWLEYGGWYDKSFESDGRMYERFVAENGARYTWKVLGEHW